MPEKSQTPESQPDEPVKRSSSEIDPAEDGRSKEWQDRARVNLETVEEGTRTNIERDFEPENLNEEGSGKSKNDPVY